MSWLVTKEIFNAGQPNLTHQRGGNSPPERSVDQMKNPWVKKNPFLSMWLSGANAVLGSARGHAAAHANRQMKTIRRAATRQVAQFWTGGTAGGSGKRKRTSGG
jgi:hypothetical protein